MRLNYNVLCIDDEIQSLDLTKSELRSLNDTVGIKTTFKDVAVKPEARETDPTAYKKRIQNEISEAFSKASLDLIMVDLHLGPSDSAMGFKGHEIIAFIRESQTMYRPIVFYSGGEPKEDTNAINQLNKDILDNDLAGKSVFLSSRGANLNDMLRRICTEMHKEEHKLNASRGLLMDRTSEVDAGVLNILRKTATWTALNEDQKASFFTKASKKLEKRATSATSKGELFQRLSQSGFDELKKWFLESDLKVVINTADSSVRNAILYDLLVVQPALKINGEVLGTYFYPKDNFKPISNIRNEYAHKTEQDLVAEHSDGRCKFIREELRKHLANISQL